ncbi:MAG TPA: hypothetical protein VL551_34010 [Actinospica sp.]|jgi:hypothetical protein|nr:hypothetical protein [Actinospica sp.]
MSPEPKSVRPRAGCAGSRVRASARPAARLVAALLAAAAALLIALPGASAATPAKAAAPVAAAPVLADPAASPSPSPSGSGIGLGPGAPTPTPTPSTSGASTATTSSGGGDPSFWDIPGQVEKAINDWVASLVTDALNPVLSLLGSTVLSTPDVTTMPRVGEIWTTMAVLANSLYVLFVLAGGAIVMTHETLQTRYALKDIAPRLFAGFLVGNASLALLGLIIHLADALSAGIMGQGLDPQQAGTALAHMITGSVLNTGGIFLSILGLVAAVMAVVLLVTYMVRVALMVLLAVAAPVALACHALPHTEGFARWWWRAVLGTLAVQLGQSLTLVTALRIFLDPGGQTSLGFPTGSGLTDLLVFITLFFILIKIPFWVGRSVFGPSKLLSMAKGIAAYKLMGPAAGLIGGGKRRTSTTRPATGRGPGPRPPGTGGGGGGPRPGGAGGRPNGSGPRYVQAGLFPPPARVPRAKPPRKPVDLEQPGPSRSPNRQSALFDRRGQITPAAAPPQPPPTAPTRQRAVQAGLFPPPARVPQAKPPRDPVDLQQPGPSRSPYRQSALFDRRGQITPAAAPPPAAPAPAPGTAAAKPRSAPPTGASAANPAAAGSARARSATAKAPGAATGARPASAAKPVKKPAPKPASGRGAAARKPTNPGGSR